jgi:hypothetical protein
MTFLSRVQVDDSPGFPDVPSRVQDTWEFPTFKVDDQHEKFQTFQVEYKLKTCLGILDVPNQV